MPIFRRDLPPAPRPNILVLTSDDMNCDSVGVYGGKFKEPTPHLDRLADQSRDGRSLLLSKAFDNNNYGKVVVMQR